MKKNWDFFLTQLWNIYSECDFPGLEENLMLSPFSFHCLWMNSDQKKKKKVASQLNFFSVNLDIDVEIYNFS